MKKLVFLFVLLFSFVACSSDGEEITQQNQSLVGTWQLVEEFFGNIEGESQWTNVENGYFYTFTENHVLLSNRYTCEEGTYLLHDETDTLTFDCEQTGLLINDYKIEFKNNYLILKPKPLCDEGCKFKYEKIKSEN